VLLKAIRLFTLSALLMPGAWYAWQWRAMPHASEYHDDGIYYVSGKAMAETGRYVIESLPSEPMQTKYPPLWPATLSLAWRMDPFYPDNLTVAMLLCWIWLPVSMGLLYLWWRSAGLSTDLGMALCVAWALNPYVVLFSSAMLSEMQFTCLLIATLLCLRPEGLKWAAAAGFLAGMTFLSRTAGIALLPVGMSVYLLRGSAPGVVAFCGAMLPSVAGWALWAGANRAEGNDAITLYYTNYFGFYLSIFEWRELHLYLWKNLDGMLRGLGALVLPDTTQSLVDKVLAETIGVAGIIGVYRMARGPNRDIYGPYAGFAVIYGLMLVVWHFPPTERLMLPVAPLWLAGLLTELVRLGRNMAAVFQKPDRGQRVAGGIMAGIVVALGMYCGARQFALLTEGLDSFYSEHSRRLEQSEPAMTWIRENLPVGARILSENDPLLYLRTGRRGAALQVMLTTIHWYREDHTARTADYLAAADLARKNRLEYLVLNDWDFARDMPAAEQEKIIRALHADPRLEQLYASGPTRVFRVR
jgi:hypothetical protein